MYSPDYGNAHVHAWGYVLAQTSVLPKLHCAALTDHVAVMIGQLVVVPSAWLKTWSQNVQEYWFGSVRLYFGCECGYAVFALVDSMH